MDFCTSLLTCDRRGSDLCSVLASSSLPVNTREIFLEMEKDGRPNPFGRLFLQLSEKRRAGDKNMPPRNFGEAYFGITPNCNINFPYRPDAFRLNKQNEEKRFRSCWTPLFLYSRPFTAQECVIFLLPFGSEGL